MTACNPMRNYLQEAMIMNLQFRKFSFYSMLAAAALWSATPLHAADHADHHPTGSAAGGKMGGCAQVMQERQEMMSQIKEQDQQLQRLAGQLSQGSQEQKTDRLVQIVQQLVKARVEAHEKMEAMHPRMMQHMAQHMQKGQTSMAQCPMMKSNEAMGGSGDDTPQDPSAHAQHQGTNSSSNPK